MFQSSTIPVLEQVVNFTQARHGVLAGNIANLDTPGYRTRDLSPELFRERLQDAIDASKATTSRYPTPINASATTAEGLDAFREVSESMRSILFHDESDVSMERQITEIAKNQAEHNLAINIMAAQFRLLRVAITETVA